MDIVKQLGCTVDHTKIEDYCYGCGYRLDKEYKYTPANCPTAHSTVYYCSDCGYKNKVFHDPVNHPSHYANVVPGIECIDVVQHFSFCRGNAIKYLWRAGKKGNTQEDLLKAIWYIQREIDTLDL